MDDLVLFLTVVNTMFSLFNFYHTYASQKQGKTNGLMIGIGVVNVDQRLREIEKMVGVPPAYEENSSSPSSSSSPHSDEEGDEDEATQIPYSPSPSPDQMSSYSRIPVPSGINLDEID